MNEKKVRKFLSIRRNISVVFNHVDQILRKFVNFFFDDDEIINLSAQLLCVKCLKGGDIEKKNMLGFDEIRLIVY